MMIRVLFALLAIMVLAVLAIQQTSLVVPPDRVAVIERGGTIARIEQPGLRWHNPILDRVGHIPVSRLYRQQANVAAKLADGSDCRIRATIAYRVTDPARAYGWRVSRGIDVSESATAREIGIEGEALPAFEAAVLATALRQSPEDAARGAIDSWLDTYQPPAFADGTMIVQVDREAISCSRAANTRR